MFIVFHKGSWRQAKMDVKHKCESYLLIVGLKKNVVALWGIQSQLEEIDSQL